MENQSPFCFIHHSFPPNIQCLLTPKRSCEIKTQSGSASALSKGANECYTSLGNPILGQRKCLYTKQRCCFQQSISCTRGREVLIVEQTSSCRGVSAQRFRNINLPSFQVTNHFLHLLTGSNLTLKDNPLQDPHWL